MNKLIVLFFSCCIVQAQNFTKQDSLRGSITPERSWWNVINYDLDINIYPDTKNIIGSNTITYKVVKPNKTLQIELQKPLIIDSIIQNNKNLTYQKTGFSHFINLRDNQEKNSLKKIKIYYHGQPKEAKNAPWDGGIVWSKDKKGNDFIATANQYIGSSIWWPCKDHPADEANSMEIKLTSPKNLINVSNGKNILIKKNKDNTVSYTWKVTNPINNYSISLNIANYAHFSEIYKGLKGNLDCNYYVLPKNLNKAKQHFKDVPKMLEAFEYWFGPYPFYEDGYKLIETPYLGMEHQSGIAYGNKYLKGYLGRPMGSSNWGNKFDFIIIHESGHEWFANSITCNDIADLWIHEAFTSYSEALYLEFHYGKKAADEYVQGLKDLVQNDKPITGYYNVHDEGSNDMYTKGSLMLHTLRQIVNDDIRWRNILKGLNQEFYHQTVSGKQIKKYISDHTLIDLSEFFNQYLTTTKIPTLVLKTEHNKVYYKWENVIANFKMPVKIYLNDKVEWIFPNDQIWKELNKKNENIKFDKNYYINIKNL